MSRENWSYAWVSQVVLVVKNVPAKAGVSESHSVLSAFLRPHGLYAAAAAKSLQSCPTLCDPIDGSPPGSAVPGILQARTQEWVAISSSNA